jgi:hypothetical protein
MDLEIRVEGIADARLTRSIARSLRLIAKQEAQPGEWTLLVAPSENRGEWDIGVRSPGRHLFASFRAEPIDLPRLVDGQFRAALAAARHP